LLARLRGAIWLLLPDLRSRIEPSPTFLHLLAALTAYQLNAIKPDVSSSPFLSLPA
jgi:hypothetical protein